MDVSALEQMTEGVLERDAVLFDSQPLVMLGRWPLQEWPGDRRPIPQPSLRQPDPQGRAMQDGQADRPWSQVEDEVGQSPDRICF